MRHVGTILRGGPQLTDVIVRFTDSAWDRSFVIVTVEQGDDELEANGWRLESNRVIQRDDVKPMMWRLLARGATIEVLEAGGRFSSRQWQPR